MDAMRGVHVDERDSQWERSDPRFRIFVYEGAGNAVDVVELEGASIEQALDAARSLSHENERLWSLALFERDRDGVPGLIWLSGMDYNDSPANVDQWRRRAVMQDRYLGARVLRGEQPVLPSGLRVIRLFPDWAQGWPLWENFTDRYRLAEDDLGLSAELSRALFDWNEVWLSRSEEDPEPEGWRAAGEELFARLAHELDGVAEVRPDYLF